MTLTAAPATHDPQPYEAPAVELIGMAADVVLGFPGGDADGPYGFTEPDFEFQADPE